MISELSNVKILDITISHMETLTPDTVKSSLIQSI